MKYEVLSSNFSRGKQGDHLSEGDLEGCNVPASISAGHLAEVADSKAPSASTDKKEK